MIKLVLEDGSSWWQVRCKPDCLAPAVLDLERRYPSRCHAREAITLLRGGDWHCWLEAYEVFGGTRTEVLSWPAREDFDAWVARVKSVTKPRKRRPRIAKEPVTVTVEPTSVSFVEGIISEAEANALDSNVEYRAQLREIIEAAMKRVAGKKGTGMAWEEKL